MKNTFRILSQMPKKERPLEDLYARIYGKITLKLILENSILQCGSNPSAQGY
jgi:hypothetical protein